MVVRMQSLMVVAAFVAMVATSVHARKYFYQNVCSDASCRDGCQESELPQNECLITTNGGSAVCHCTETAFEQDVYVFTENCTMYYYPQTAELGVCLNGQSGYVEYACPSSYRDHSTHRHAKQEATADARHPVIAPLEGLHRFGRIVSKVPSSARRTSGLIGLKQLRDQSISAHISGNVMRIHVDGHSSEKELVRIGVLAHSVRRGGVTAHIVRSDLTTAVPLDNLKDLTNGMTISYDASAMRLVLELPLDQLAAIRRRHKVSADDHCHVMLVDEIAHEELITLAL